MSEAIIRFFAHVEDYSSLDKCWIWRTKKNKFVYGAFNGAGIFTKAHRWIWIYLHGPLSNREHIHHKCHDRRCVNPCHLERLSVSSHNMLHIGGNQNTGKTHCKRGHEFNESNTYYYKDGRRLCKPCQAYHTREWRKRNA